MGLILLKKDKLQTLIGKFEEAKNCRSERVDIIKEQLYSDIREMEDGYLDPLIFLFSYKCYILGQQPATISIFCLFSVLLM